MLDKTKMIQKILNQKNLKLIKISYVLSFMVDFVSIKMNLWQLAMILIDSLCVIRIYKN